MTGRSLRGSLEGVKVVTRTTYSLCKDCMNEHHTVFQRRLHSKDHLDCPCAQALFLEDWNQDHSSWEKCALFVRQEKEDQAPEPLWVVEEQGQDVCCLP